MRATVVWGKGMMGQITITSGQWKFQEFHGVCFYEFGIRSERHIHILHQKYRYLVMISTPEINLSGAG